MKTSASIINIAPALLKSQREMGDATKSAKNPFFKSKYADLNAVREAAIPVFNSNGIGVFQPTVEENGKSFVETILIHESGEWASSQTEILYAKAGDPQGQGSGISYARRYGLQSFANMGAVDDDGEVAMSRPVHTPKAEIAKNTTPVASATAVAIANAPAQAPILTTGSFNKNTAGLKKPVTVTGNGTAEFPKVTSTTEDWS